MAFPARSPERTAVALATLFGLGHLPVPGTFGSLVAALLFLAFVRLLPGESLLLAHLVWLGVLLPVAVWTSAAAVRVLGRSDPPVVIIDELVGQHLALLPLALPGAFGWKMWAAGFILFRVIDATKPFPIRRLERWRGGWGVVADDLLAGVYTAVIVAAARYAGLSP